MALTTCASGRDDLHRSRARVGRGPPETVVMAVVAVVGAAFVIVSQRKIWPALA
jgi:hypothetical protein